MATGYTDPRTGVFYPAFNASDLEFGQNKMLSTSGDWGGGDQYVYNPTLRFIGDPRNYWGPGIGALSDNNYLFGVDANGNPTLKIKTEKDAGNTITYKKVGDQWVPDSSSLRREAYDTTPTFMEQGGGVLLAGLGGLGAQYFGVPGFTGNGLAPWEAGLTNAPLPGFNLPPASTPGAVPIDPGPMPPPDVTGPPVGAANPGTPGAWAPGSYPGDPFSLVPPDFVGPPVGAANPGTPGAWNPGAYPGDPFGLPPASTPGMMPTDPGPIPPEYSGPTPNPTTNPPLGSVPGAAAGAGAGAADAAGGLLKWIKDNPGLVSLGAGLLGGLFGNSGTQVQDLYGGRKAAMDRLAANQAPASPWGRY